MNVLLKIESYIASPYWPETSKLIDIAKGIHPKLGDAKKKEALQATLQKLGISKEEYQALQERSQQKWYKDTSGKIYIPRHQIAGMLVQTVKRAPKPIRGKFDEDSFRSLVCITDFATSKTDKDELFERYVKHDATNQRRFQSDEVIKDFEATGTVTLRDEVDQDDFVRLLTYAVQVVGVGSCRKMGYGRGDVISPTLRNPLDFKGLGLPEKEEAAEA